jgi:hypothetical protein
MATDPVHKRAVAYVESKLVEPEHLLRIPGLIAETKQNQARVDDQISVVVQTQVDNGIVFVLESAGP